MVAKKPRREVVVAEESTVEAIRRAALGNMDKDDGCPGEKGINVPVLSGSLYTPVRVQFINLG